MTIFGYLAHNPFQPRYLSERRGFLNMSEKTKIISNNVRQHREGLLVSKAELARKAGISALTIDRVEKGMQCRMDTMRKILIALGLKLTDKEKVFPNS